MSGSILAAMRLASSRVSRLAAVLHGLRLLSRRAGISFALGRRGKWCSNGAFQNDTPDPESYQRGPMLSQMISLTSKLPSLVIYWMDPAQI